MSDTKISALPVVTSTAGADIIPIVQGSGVSAITRRATVTQLRGAVLSGRSVSIGDFGAVGDGVTNDGPAIQAAINSLTGTGGTILFAAKRYRVATAVVIDSEAITLQGMGFTEGPNAADGTWITIDTTGFTPFTFTGTSARGSAVRDIAFRQTHPSLAPGWTPTNYDFVFRVQDCLGAVDFRNVFLCSINRGIFCDNSGRLNVERLRGQVFTTGIEIDRCFDIPRVNYVHFWPFGTSDANVIGYQQQNLDALLLRRVDGIFMDDIFVLGARSVFRFSSSAGGTTTKFYLGNAYTDFAKYGLWIEGSDVSGQIANLTTQGELITPAGAPIVGGTGIRIDGSNARIQIANLRIDAVETNAIQVNGANNRLDVFSLRVEKANIANNASPAINLLNVGAGTPNQIYLGSPALIANSNGAALLNAGTNGFVASMSPAGSIANPGTMVGATNTGLSSPAADQLAISTGGVEVLRAQSGTVTIGGAPGAHALGVITPASTVNQLRITGGIAGQPVIAHAQGSDTNIALSLRSKGTGAVQIAPNAILAFEALAGATQANYLRANGAVAAGRVSVQAQGSDTNVGFDIASKGTGTLALQVNSANALVVTNPASAVNFLQASGAATAGKVSVQALGSDANVSFDISAKGSGVLGLQSNSAYAFVITNPTSAVNYIQGTGAITGTGPLITVNGTDTNAALRLSAKGTAPVSALSPLQLPSFTVATLPAAASYPRALIYVSDGTAAKRLAISDGAAWRWPDGAVVS
ncbi:MAG: glycosyl hydrolase family 28-related protein [Pseudomonadota bacterium]